MMKTRHAAILIAVLTALGVGTLAAQEIALRGAVRTVKVPVKQYKTLSPADVYRAAIDNIQADVRFRDGFAGRTGVPNAVRQVTVQGFDYPVAVAFRTEVDLVCLVPAPNEEALRALFAVPEQWPLTAATLDGPMVLNVGQQINIEGTIVGATIGEKYVLVDAILLGAERPPATQRELQLFWPTMPQPEIISAPGMQTLTLPCTYAEGETVDVRVIVRAMQPEALMAELARITAEREGVTAARKAYGQYDPGVVYRHARDGNPLNVDFTDTVNRIIGYSLATDIAAAPALRGGSRVAVTVGYAFRTSNQLTCLVPADMPTLMGRAVSALPGEEVHIRGTIIGGPRAAVLVDYIGFPAQEAEGDTWLVNIEWPGLAPRVFWDYGYYELVGLPCQHAPGRFEALRVFLTEVRILKFEMPAEAPE